MDFKTIRFIVLASALYGLFHFAYYKIPNDVLGNKIYPAVIGNLAAEVINTVTPDRNVKAHNNALISKKAKLNIVRGCDGSGVLFMLTAAILGFGATFRQTIIGLALGIATVYLINQVRIIGLFYLIEYNRMWFPPVHTYYAPTLIILLISGFFLLWTRWVVNEQLNQGSATQTGLSVATKKRLMTGGKLSAYALRALVIWFALSQVGDRWGEHLVQPLFPLYESVVIATSDYDTVNLEVAVVKSVNQIQLSASSSIPLAITPQIALPPNSTIASSAAVLHALVPIIILLTVILSWPVPYFRQRLYLIGASIPLILLVSAITVPSQLLGNLEIGFQEAAVKFGHPREEPFVLTWMLVTEGGARWLIPALFGLGAVALVQRLSKKGTAVNEK